MVIELRYDPQNNTLAVVNGSTTVHRGTRFSFISTPGPLETQFSGDSPDERDVPAQRQPANHDYHATKPGRYQFRCFINGVEAKIGGDMEVLPTEP